MNYLLCSAMLMLLVACAGTYSPSSSSWPDDHGVTGARISVSEMKAMLSEHNRVRRDVNLPSLTWSKQLAGVAQEWAEVLAHGKCELQHRSESAKKWHKPKLGENLFMGTAGYYTFSGSAVAAWESEKKDYDNKPVSTDKINAYGHYTQIIWKTTHSVGCGKAYCQGNVIVACNYSPPGNYIGQMPYE